MTRHAQISAGFIPHWIGDRCELHPSFLERAGALYESWRLYAKAHGREPGSPSEFAAEMERRGFGCDQLSRGDRARIRWGIRLRLVEEAP